MDKLLTIKEVCELLRVDRKTVESWLHSGKLKGYKFGKLWRVSLSDLEAMGGQDAVK